MPAWDENIATLRAFAMMHVLVVHSLFWPVHPELYSDASIFRALFLFEMPLFFFLTGACNKSGKRGILNFYFSRFQRIVPAYLVYCLLGAALTFATGKGLRQGFSDIFYLFSVFPPPGAPVTHLPYLTRALWFVPVYLSIVLILPLLQRIHHSCRQPYACIPFVGCALILFALVFFSFPGNPRTGNILSYVIFYSFWAYLGFYYDRLDLRAAVKTKIKVIPLIIVCFSITGVFVYGNKNFSDMQANKFPPNFVFLAYSLGVMGLLYLFYSTLHRFLAFCRCLPAFAWIFTQYSTHTYTIFLYHPLCFLAIKFLSEWLALWDKLCAHPFLCISVHAVLAIPLGAILGRFLSWPERIKFFPVIGKS
ncbi:MAG: acyltransferase [Puniceicoccales bacterium]|nr:acyltransferase [Puniceicoccales bacterium]